MFDWAEFLNLAAELAARTNDEAAARTAISRAYYATFHFGRQYLFRSDILVDRSRNAHRQVQLALRALDEELADDVERLHEWRKIADYAGVSFPDVSLQAVVAVRLAHEAITRINALA